MFRKSREKLCEENMGEASTSLRLNFITEIQTVRSHLDGILFFVKRARHRFNYQTWQKCQ